MTALPGSSAAADRATREKRWHYATLCLVAPRGTGSALETSVRGPWAAGLESAATPGVLFPFTTWAGAKTEFAFDLSFSN
jgi:hypothetical protein